MNRAILIGGAVSGLVLACAAYAANTSYNLTVQGSIAAYCDVRTASALATYGSSGSSTDTQAATLAFPGLNNFANSTGNGLHVGGRATLKVRSNSTCTYQLTSDNGTLWNSHTNTGRPYTADLYNSDLYDSGTPFPLGSTSKTTTNVGPAFDVPGTGNVVIEFDAKEDLSVVLAAGDYADTLRLSITAH